MNGFWRLLRSLARSTDALLTSTGTPGLDEYTCTSIEAEFRWITSHVFVLSPPMVRWTRIRVWTVEGHADLHIPALRASEDEEAEAAILDAEGANP